MNGFRLNMLSLRARFLLWQFAVLTPLLFTALIGQFYLLPQLVEPLQEIAEEVTNEVMLVKNQQVALLMAAMPVNDYLVSD